MIETTNFGAFVLNSVGSFTRQSNGSSGSELVELMISIGKAKTNGNEINIQTIKFPCAEAGLPDSCENIDSIPSPHLLQPFYEALSLLQQPLEQLLVKQHPNCIVADFFFPWATDSAAKFGIPRLVFHGTGFFSLCVNMCVGFYEPYNHVSSDSELFVIPNLPGEIKMTMMQLPPFMMSKEKTGMAKLLEEANESELRSYGVVVNSFYELEKVYADHFRKVLGRKAWHIGPLYLCNKDIITDLPDSQLRDIAMGLEASGQQFIWVVRRSGKDGEEWLPDGFEKSMEGKGLIIRGWTPQVLILEHEAIGAFVTHCGWNSTLEAVTAGVPMVTWPIAAEQFFKEKLVTEVLRIGVPVGAKKWVRLKGDSITCDAVEKAVKRIMNGKEPIEMRNRTKVLSQLANHAMEEGGSSYTDLNALIQGLSSLSH
ncbi:hypothetical protein VNO78_34166 [Psophocarpus tetragonolobus]|uniref:Glycosyltransferase n=1 Tax=Psophocarpus tetragonolobus TaxID=3891 RepID=A0AAN9NVD4_PSOTE